MPELLDVSAAGADPDPVSPADPNNLRLLSRSPHPYHRHNSELLEPAQVFTTPKLRPRALQPRSHRSYDSNDVSLSSASGTEADDEHFLKGLPAPKRHHKGVRGLNEISSGTNSPVPSPAILKDDSFKFAFSARRSNSAVSVQKAATNDTRRSKEVARRLLEIAILGGLGLAVQSNPQVRQALRPWKHGTVSWWSKHIEYVVLIMEQSYTQAWQSMHWLCYFTLSASWAGLIYTVTRL